MSIIKKNSMKLVYKLYTYKTLDLLDYINVYKMYFFNRSDVILRSFIRRYIIIHNGKYWVYIKVNRWKVGYKIGCFSWNRKRTGFVKKKKKKK